MTFLQVFITQALVSGKKNIYLDTNNTTTDKIRNRSFVKKKKPPRGCARGRIGTGFSVLEALVL